MPSIPPLVFLLGGFVCSLVGRGMLIRSAFSVGKAWGLSVLLVPLAPLFFRWNYKELAMSGQHWRTATTCFAVLFIMMGGSGSVTDVSGMWGSKDDTAGIEDQAHAGSRGANPFMAHIAGLITKSKPIVPATQSEEDEDIENPPTAPAATPLPPTAERLMANQREFARLEQVYAELKRERGYLRKNDVAGTAAFNEQAAAYQAALASARAERVELNKLSLAKK